MGADRDVQPDDVGADELRPVTRAQWLLAVGVLFGALTVLGVGAVGALYVQGARGVCPTEDSVSCVWVGPVQGNGGGRVVVNGPERR